MLLLGCAAPQPSLGEQVPLLTGRVVPGGGRAGCYTNYLVGVLTVDETYGTKMAWANTSTTQPIMWPIGYKGFRVGSGVTVVNEHGTVVAVTGNQYGLWMGAANRDQIEPNVPGAYLTCDTPIAWPPPGLPSPVAHGAAMSFARA